MANFHYKAIKQTGDFFEGEMVAASEAEVIRKLNELGHIPVGAEEVGTSVARNWLNRELFAGRHVSQREITLLTRELATLLQAGIELERALDIIVSLSERPAMQEMLRRVLDAVRGGSAFADALEAQDGGFSRSYVSMIRAGEAGGALEVVVGRIADLLERSQAARENLKSALIYPTVLLVTAVASVLVMVTVVLPRFKPLFENAGKTLPLATRFVMGAGEALEQYGWLAALVVCACVLLFRQHIKTPSARLRWHRWLLCLPFVGELVTKLEVARFTRTLGTLLGNGVPMLTSLGIVRETLGNMEIATAIDGVAGRVEQGSGLADAIIAANVLPPLAGQLIMVGEESGRLEDMLFKTADIYDQEAQRTIGRLLAILLPGLTIVIGLIIAGIIASIFVAILSVNELAF